MSFETEGADSFCKLFLLKFTKKVVNLYFSSHCILSLPENLNGMLKNFRHYAIICEQFEENLFIY